MIQLKKSQDTNTFAFYPDVEVDSSINDLSLEYVQDLDKSSGTFFGIITSKKNWVVGQVSGSDLPAPSGQYTLTLKETRPEAPLKWSEAYFQWQAADITWSDAKGRLPGQILAVERAYIEGSNEAEFTTYSSPNETGTYTTYNS